MSLPLMRRGDLVTVAVAGDYGKPRPAVVVQSDTLSELDSVVVCQLTSQIGSPASFRILVAPEEGTGLRVLSEIVADKPVTVRRSRIGTVIGRLSANDLERLDAALVSGLGLAD